MSSENTDAKQEAPAADPTIDLQHVEAQIAEAAEALVHSQADDGHWVYELESDATIPAEYILYGHYLDEVDEDLEQRIATYLREIQGAHGGWPLFHDGDVDVSATVKAYYALKLAGDDIEAPHMKQAREAILGHGGAERSNVFTRITLALFEQVPWRAVPVLPMEVVCLPKWFPFHLNKVSYWARTVMTPLLVVAALKPKARNPRGIGISELFVTPPDEVKKYNINPTGSAWGEFFLVVDRLLRMVEEAGGAGAGVGKMKTDNSSPTLLCGPDKHVMYEMSLPSLFN